MFERSRIGAALYNLCDSLTRQGAPVSRTAIKDWTDEFMDIAVKDMKALKLHPDQAAVALIINLVNALHNSGFLDTIRNAQYDRFISLIRLYHGACRLIDERPDYFRRAQVLIDHDVFEATFRHE